MLKDDNTLTPDHFDLDITKPDEIKIENGELKKQNTKLMECVIELAKQLSEKPKY